MNRPEPGLIVSCYMHSMKDCTKSLIDTIWEIDDIKTLRIEGIENINHAKKLKDIKHKYIIGLIKDQCKELAGLPYISASIDDIKRLCDYSGADMIAIDSRWRNGNSDTHDYLVIKNLYRYAQLPIMADIELEEEADVALSCGASIIATTFLNKGFELAKKLAQKGVPVNLEGGLSDFSDIRRAKKIGASWWTVGRAIHDVKTTIKQFTL